MMKCRVILIGLFLIFIFNTAAHSFQNEGTYEFGELKLFVKATIFKPEDHQITKCKIFDWEGICLINEKPVFGADMGMPKTMLDEALVFFEGKTIPLDVSAMFNPWFQKPVREQFKIRKIEGGWAVIGFFSDGAGSYVTEWRIISGQSLRTVISGDEMIYLHMSEMK